MAVNTVNTRLILRNDALSSWNNSDKILLKGEAALALHTANDDVYKNRYEIRIGDGEHAFSALAPTNIVFPWEAISGAPAAATYELSVSDNAVSACVISTDVNNNTVGRAGSVFSLQTLSDEISNKVVVKEGDTTTAVSQLVINKVSEDTYASLMKQSALCSDQIYSITGNTTSINNFGLPLVSVGVPTLSNDAATKGYVDDISNDIRSQITGISDAISNPTYGLNAIGTNISNDIYGDDGISSQVTSNAQNISNLSTGLTTPTTGLCARVTALENATTRGVNFIGHVSSITNGQNGQAGTYVLVDGGEPTAASAGNIVILNGVEYIYSDVSQKWEQFGDEGNMATTAYVDDAKAEAISATTNKYYTAATIAELSNYSTYVVGDVAVIKTEIGSGTGKYQYTAYYYAGNNTWEAMDGNYSAENVYFSDNIIMTYKFGKYDASDANNITLSSKGKSLQQVMADALADIKQPSLTTPSLEISCNGGTGEIGSQYTVADAKLIFHAGKYQYAPTATNISVNIGNSKLSSNAGSGGAGTAVQNASVLVDLSSYTLDNTLTARYLSTGATYNISANATYTAAPAAPKTNIGTESDIPAIAAGTITATQTATYTGYYPAYWGFSTSPTSTPTAITANNANTLKINDNLTLTRELNSFSKTSFVASSGWFELFYLVPTAKQAKTKWTGKDSNRVDLAVETSGSATVTFLNGSTASYRVFIVRNAAVYSATTCTMTFAS